MRVLLIAHSRRGARARTDTVRTRAASGIMSTGITAGARGAAAGLGQERAGYARELPRPRKPGLESKSRGLETLVRAAVERRKASASRWTRGPARSAYGWQHPMRGEAPRDSCAFSALRLPLFFWRQKLRGFDLQNSGAGASRERDRFSFRPREAGEGDHWSSRSERTVVEGAPVSTCWYRCRTISVDAELTLNHLRCVESCAPSTTLLRRVVPLPRYRGA